MSDSTSLLDQIDRTAAASDVLANELLDAASPATAFGRHASASAGLTWAYYGSRYGGTAVPNGTVALTASSTCYIVADRSSGAVSVSTATTHWLNTTAYARLYKVTTGVSSATSWEDHRCGPGGLFGAGLQAVPDGDYGDVVVSGGGAAMNIDAAVLTTFGRTLTSAANAGAGRTALGLGTAATLDSDDDTTLAANSAARLATQHAVKAYIDSVVTGGAVGVMIFKGSIDCSANPNYPAADAGNVYKVSVAGKIGGASGPNVEVGDTLYCITNGTAAGNQATVGSAWNIVQENIDGAVTGQTSSVDGEVALFSGTTGKIIKRLTGSGYMKVASGVASVLTAAQLRADLGEKVQALTDGATISVDASLGDNCRVTLAGNRTLANPTNLIDGQVLNFRIKQDGTGSRTLAYGTKYKFAGGTAPTLSTAAGSLDFLSCQYDATDDTLVCVLNKAFA